MQRRMKRLYARARAHLHGAKEALFEHAYLITLSAVITIIAVTAMYTSRVREENAPGIQAAAQAPETQQALPTEEPAAQATPLPTIAPLTVHQLAVRPGGSTVQPLSGGVIRGYSADTPVLWEALSCYQVHMGLDIAGEAGEDVLCVMDGVVSSASRDDLWGWHVQVEQTDGALATYSGLELCALEAGQSITRGQTLGTLMSAIPCEAELGAHLHFELTRDGMPEDPTAMIDGAQPPAASEDSL